MRVKWQGKIRVAEVTRAIRTAAADGLNNGSELILQEANRHVPLEEATLERSGKVSEATPDSLAAAVSYDTPYAVVQHESMDYRHDPGRWAKWLEIARNEKAPTVAALVAERIRNARG